MIAKNLETLVLNAKRVNGNAVAGLVRIGSMNLALAQAAPADLSQGRLSSPGAADTDGPARPHHPGTPGDMRAVRRAGRPAGLSGSPASSRSLPHVTARTLAQTGRRWRVATRPGCPGAKRLVRRGEICRATKPFGFGRPAASTRRSGGR